VLFSFDILFKSSEINDQVAENVKICFRT